MRTTLIQAALGAAACSVSAEMRAAFAPPTSGQVVGPWVYPPNNPNPKPQLSGAVKPQSEPSTTSASDACAQVSSAVAAQSAVATPKVSAKLAYDCATSVPFNATSALELADSLRPYIQWQSTQAYLPDPPAGYLEPPYDFFAAYDKVLDKVKSGSYATEYDFEYEVYRIFQDAHDGHFRYYPNLIRQVFAFGRPIPLVSVSKDGVEIPQVYAYPDIVLTQGGAKFEPSIVTKINDQDAVPFLESLSQLNALQDPDALYNNLFYELASISLGSTASGAGFFAGGLGRSGTVYPGPTTTLTFANGTNVTYENFANVLVPFDGIANGVDLYNTWVDPAPAASSAAAASSTAAATATPAPGFPPPVIRQAENMIGGYYLDKPGYEDVAVLSVPTFVGGDGFQDVSYNFFKMAKEANKTKLVIDVSVNGGGTIFEGYNIFTELFPDLPPYDGTRFRTFDDFNVIGEFISDRAGPDYPGGLFQNIDLASFIGTPFDYRADIDMEGNPFTSWAEKNGPHEYHGDNFTSIIRFDLNDPSEGYNVTGYGNRTGLVQGRWFDAKDIVIVYDGYCASTCTIFSEFMRLQAGVKAIAMGGRPTEGIIQAVGGVKGRNDYTWGDIFSFVNSTFNLATPEQRQEFSQTGLADYNTIPFRRGFGNNHAVNVRDGIRKDDKDQTPTQFIYEAADCRLYWTPEMTVEISAVWEKAADVTWKGASCVAGGIGAPANASAKYSVPDGAKYRRQQTARNVDVEGLMRSINEPLTPGIDSVANGYVQH